MIVLLPLLLPLLLYMAAAVGPNCSDPQAFHNYSDAKCHGLLNAAAGDASPAECFGVCCADSGCRTWQWAKGSKGGCWTGTCENRLSKDKGWVGGDRSKSPPSPWPSPGPLPPKPTPTPPPPGPPGHQTTITVDSAAFGPVFEGVGGASGGGGGTRLLVDYPLKQRGELLDVLFRPKFGASLQQLKVEIG